MIYQQGTGIIEEQRSRRPLVITVIAIAAAIVSLFIILPRLNGPAASSVHEDAAKTSAAPEVANFTPVAQTGQYARFTYPAQLKPAPAAAVVSPLLEHWIYLSKSPHSWQLAVTVETLPEGDLMQNSSYRVFHQKPADYVQQVLNVKGQTVYLFTDQTQGSFSRIAFLPQAGKVATVALQGSDSGGDAVMQRVLDMVLQSWQW